MSGRHARACGDPNLNDVTKCALALGLCGALFIVLLCVACAATVMG